MNKSYRLVSALEIERNNFSDEGYCDERTRSA